MVKWHVGAELSISGSRAQLTRRWFALDADVTGVVTRGTQACA